MKSLPHLYFGFVCHSHDSASIRYVPFPSLMRPLRNANQMSCMSLHETIFKRQPPGMGNQMRKLDLAMDERKKPGFRSFERRSSSCSGKGRDLTSKKV